MLAELVSSVDSVCLGLLTWSSGEEAPAFLASSVYTAPGAGPRCDPKGGLKAEASKQVRFSKLVPALICKTTEAMPGSYRRWMCRFADPWPLWLQSHTPLAS